MSLVSLALCDNDCVTGIDIGWGKRFRKNPGTLHNGGGETKG